MNSSTTPRALLPRLMQHMGVKKVLLPIGIVVSLIAHAVAVVPFVLIWKIIDLLFARNAVPDASLVGRLAWWALIAAVLFSALYFAALMITHVAAFRTERSIRYHAVARAMGMPLGFFANESTGKLKKVVDENAGLIHTFVAHQLADLVGGVTMLAMVLILLIGMDWRMGLASLIPIVIAIAAMGSMMSSKAYHRAMDAYMNHLEKMNSEAVEYIRGIPVVKTFQQTIFSFNAFYKAIKDYETWATRYSRSCRTPMVIYSVAAQSFVFFLIPTAILLIALGAPTDTILGKLVFYILLTPLFGQTIMKLMFMVSGQQQAKQALDRIEELFEGTAPFKGQAELPAENGMAIELRNVTFSYKSDTPPALCNVSLTIPAGKKYALVGSSGSGKTTIARLIARFWAPQEGSVFIGGQNLESVSPEAIHRQMAFVFQNDRLFKTTIRENIAYGRPNATEAEINRAIDLAQCRELIESLPAGLDTKLGAEGVYLSGGEQQRVALCRAFLKNAPILILDEATAFADPEHEAAIHAALQKLMEKKTVVMIAHRLTSITDADCIVVLSEGEIVETGTHQELTARGGVYAGMWNEYMQSVEWTI